METTLNSSFTSSILVCIFASTDIHLEDSSSLIMIMAPVFMEPSAASVGNLDDAEPSLKYRVESGKPA